MVDPFTFGIISASATATKATSDCFLTFFKIRDLVKYKNKDFDSVMVQVRYPTAIKDWSNHLL
jgi:hypothetical protein